MTRLSSASLLSLVWDNGGSSYLKPEKMEDINTRKELLSFLRRVEELPSVK